VAGTRIPVVTILGMLGEGMTSSEVLGYYPQLVLDDVLACLGYAAAEALDQRTLPLRPP
jgi:uncharacterized protein (DUF433 family)